MMTTQSKKRKINTRPLTKSEKILISLLALVILVWASNRFIFQPQAAKLTELETAERDYEMQIIDMNNTLKSEEKINKEWEILHEERDQILAQYFPTLDQSQIIYLLNDLTKNENINIDDLSFSRPSNELLGEVDVRKMEISIPFDGNYDGIIDVINSLGASPRRILVNNLSLDRSDADHLSGNMSLKVYSLEGIAETDPNVIFVDTADNSGANTPFKAYGDFYEPSSGDISPNGDHVGEEGDAMASPDVKEGMRKQLLHEFDYGSYTFIPSGPMVKGNVTPSTIRKSGKYAMRLEYNILALEDENRAYVDLSSTELNLKIPPDTIGTWVYSYGYSPGTLGMRLKTQSGEYIEVKMAEGITWMGWSYLETSLPADLKLYPLELDKLYYELPFDRDDFGILLIDKMEAFYRLNEETTVNNQETFLFYVVELGDSVTKISESIYGTDKYKNEIMELNEIKPGELLPVGKVLVLRRR